MLFAFCMLHLRISSGPKNNTQRLKCIQHIAKSKHHNESNAKSNKHTAKTANDALAFHTIFETMLKNRTENDAQAFHTFQQKWKTLLNL